MVSKHSDGFNSAVQSAMDSYHSLTEAFVNWDSTAVVSRSNELQVKLNDIKLGEFQPQIKATASNALNLAKKDLETMKGEKYIVQERHSLNALTHNLYHFLSTVRYDVKKVYLQECPMAFNDSIAGNWLSEVDSIRNPYMGLHHPHYGKAMIACGSTKSTLNFVSKK